MNLQPKEFNPLCLFISTYVFDCLSSEVLESSLKTTLTWVLEFLERRPPLFNMS